MSPLAQGRGLKHDSGDLLVPSCFVAPRTGAWIETIAIDLCMTGDKTSPLAQGRGLKQSNQCINLITIYVAPRTGAWIETGQGLSQGFRRACRPSHRGVD